MTNSYFETDKRVEEEEESDSDEVDLNDEDEGVHEGEVKMTKVKLFIIARSVVHQLLIEHGF